MLVSFFVYLILGFIASFFVIAALVGLLLLAYAFGLPVAGIVKIFSRKS